MADTRISDRKLSIRLPAHLATDLRRVARLELNSASAVARRLIAVGLARERAEPRTILTRPDDAA